MSAKLIKYRFEEYVIKNLQHLKWWNYAYTDFMFTDFSEIHQAIQDVMHCIDKLYIQPYQSEVITGKELEAFMPFNKKVKRTRRKFKKLIGLQKNGK